MSRPMRARRLPPAALLTGCVLLLAACAGDPVPDPRTLVVGLEANPTNLDPRMATGAAAVRLIPLLFSSLLRLDPAGEPAPELALSWETRSPTEYLFHLRRGVATSPACRRTTTQPRPTQTS